MSFTALGLQYVMPEIISGTSLVLQNITLEFYTGVLNSSCAEDLLGTYDDTASGQKHPGTPPIVDNHASLTEQHIMSHIPPIPAKREPTIKVCCSKKDAKRKNKRKKT
ncbi:hypothetical protein TNCV_718271 [Trichonephila clavipes]|nr:hypothetical protein TNCV_718271 [Trichonephila clavipes]